MYMKAKGINVWLLDMSEYWDMVCAWLHLCLRVGGYCISLSTCLASTRWWWFVSLLTTSSTSGWGASTLSRIQWVIIIWGVSTKLSWYMRTVTCTILKNIEVLQVLYIRAKCCGLAKLYHLNWKLLYMYIGDPSIHFRLNNSIDYKLTIPRSISVRVVPI